MSWHPFTTTPETFWPKIDKSGGPEACWPWTGSQDGRGYGITKLHCKTIRSHRLAYIFAGGEFPEGRHCVCHRCDNRLCCNPAHLFPGSYKDNALDMVAKRRHLSFTCPERINRGEAHRWAKFTEDDIRAIWQRLQDGERPAAIGISSQLACDLKAGRCWRHVTGLRKTATNDPTQCWDHVDGNGNLTPLGTAWAGRK